MNAILETESLSAGYGDIKILHDVSVGIAEASITALVGSNGAGKTTLMRAISGLLRANSGAIRFRGADITRTSASERVTAGIALVPEGRLIFTDFSVMENLTIGAFVSRVRPERQRRMQELFEIFPRLAERAHQKGGTLSGGEQQMLAIARGLMSKPTLLLLDEPSLGLAPQLVAQLFEVVIRIRQSGVTVAIVEQNVRNTLEISDRAYVLENGRIVLEGTGRELLADPQVKESYLGL
jgi:branched-chain amino acid transport system ATP-binding protein